MPQARTCNHVHPSAATCLVDCLRARGLKVPYTSQGPFWAIADGCRFTEPFGLLGLRLLAMCTEHPPSRLSK